MTLVEQSVELDNVGVLMFSQVSMTAGEEIYQLPDR